MVKIETEYKLELSKEEFQRVKEDLKTIGEFVRSSSLKDYFFNLERFDEKGYNFTRIRVYDEKDYERTDKIWKLINGERVREEFEVKTNLQELEDLKAKSENQLSLVKNRTDYEVFIKKLNLDGIVSLDELFLQDETRYFIEVEVETSEEDSNSVRPLLKKWLLNTFLLSDRDEGIGMMRLVLSKANLK